MATVEVTFTPLPAHVRTARLVATAVARRSGVDESLLDEVRLAVGEACSRAVEAHRRHCPAEPVRIEMTDQDQRFVVTVSDHAPTAPARPAAPAPPGDGAGHEAVGYEAIGYDGGSAIPRRVRAGRDLRPGRGRARPVDELRRERQDELAVHGRHLLNPARSGLLPLAPGPRGFCVGSARVPHPDRLCHAIFSQRSR